MMTIKQLADELGVSKQAIRNEIAKQGLQSSLTKNGNQFSIDEPQIVLIRNAFVLRKNAKLLDDNLLSICDKNDNRKSDEVCNLQFKISELELKLKLIEASDQEKIEIMEQEIEYREKQIEEKDKQIAEKDKQINELTSQLSATISALESTISALTAAQALHAGTIQERLTEHSGTSDEDTIASGEFEEAAAQNDKKPSLKQRFKYLFLGK